MPIDNSNLKAKLDLRRRFLERYAEPIHVMDCCQGDGVVWRQLREEFDVASYWGMDMKRQKGRLTIDSSQVLAQSGWTQNVVDVDVYGYPWKHWMALLPNVRQPTTVFLTLGTTAWMGMKSSGPSEQIGFPKSTPRSLAAMMEKRLGVTHRLAEAMRHGLEIVEAAEAKCKAKARYIGVRLQPCP